MGKLPPCFTRVPNFALDNMHSFGHAELKVYLAIIRQTIGWGRGTKKLTKRRIMKITGLSDRPVINSIQSLMKRKLIGRGTAGKTFFYYAIEKPCGTVLEVINTLLITVSLMVY